MTTFVLEKQYGNTLYTFNLNFKNDRQLITEYYADGQTNYILNVELASCFGTYNNKNISMRGKYNVYAPGSTYDPNRRYPVYGAYIRSNIDDSFPPMPYFGISTTQDTNVGYGSLPFEQYHFDNAVALEDEYTVTIDGQTGTGKFNAEGGITLWRLLNICITIATSNTGLQGLPGHLTFDFIIDTNCPFFDTFTKFRSYVINGTTDGLLNGYIAPAMSDFGRYYINNLVSNNGNISDILNDYYYKFNGPDKCLGFASDDGIHATLYSFNGGPTQILKSDDKGTNYEEVGSYPDTYYMRTDLTKPAYVMTFNTNIPVFESDENDSGIDKLISFINGEPAPSGRTYTGDDAWNRSQLDEFVNGKIGEVVNQTTNGTSSIAYTHGVQMFALSATQKATFLRDVLSAAKLNDLLDATKLFGTNQINALQSLRYMPIDAVEVCTIQSESSCQIGTYNYTFSSSVDQILQNNKMINLGTEFFASPYNDGDFRNLEPWCRLFVMLPYAGTHALAISKYINKRVTIKLAVDITTGACEYHLFANNCEMDAFQGVMGSQIPLTANDKASQVAAVQNGILSTAEGLTQIGNEVNEITSAVGQAAMGNFGPAISHGPYTPLDFVPGVGHTIQSAQKAINSFINAPIATKGSSAGNLGDFGVDSPYFIFAWANSLTPQNELNIVGKPSNYGGTVSEFAGFLQCSAFTMASGFGGTDDELQEISNIMANGVYVS